MAGVSKNPNSARQKMINLMYLVFIAMMALNIPAEVLDGFGLIERSLRASTDNSTKRNEQIMGSLDMAYQVNETKVREWYIKGIEVKKQSDELFSYLGELKYRIVEESDGKKVDIDDIKNKDNLDAAATIMLSPITGEGEKLKERINTYRNNMSFIVADPSKIAIFESILNTNSKGEGALAHSWESGLFENMPVAAVVAMMTKMQNDVRYIEGEVLSTLITNVDEKDFRVNKVEALVIPKSQVVTQGSPYVAQLVLAAVDSTRRPEYFLDGKLLENEWISIPSGAIGPHTVTGQIVSDGNTYEYTTSFSVTASNASVAPVLMNFLYQSIPNDVAVAMSGVPSGSVRATISSGNIVQKEGNVWTVTGLDVSKAPKVTITLSGTDMGGNTNSVSQEFMVRPLPPPMPFISYKDADGATRTFKGGLIAKRNLVETPGIEAAIDDGVLNIAHKVTGFTLLFVDGMGNYIPEVSNSSEFTPRQKDLIRNLARGKRFFINNVKALDPAGKPVAITYSMDVVVN